MQEQTTGLILRTRPLTETSLIVHWLSRDAGRVATVAKGARRLKSPLRGKLDLFFLAEFTFQRARRSELHTLREVVLLKTFPGLRTHVDRLTRAAYGAAFIELTTEMDTPVPELFDLMRGFIDHISAAPATALSVCAFELKGLSLLGLQPGLDRESLAPSVQSLARALIQAQWDSLAEIAPPTSDIRALNRMLHGFLIYHLGRLPRGRAEALA
jgi:DNA repair protein RecO (recombination protein O)